VTARKIIKAARCHVCKHVDRALIEQTRVAGASLDTIAAKYGVSRDAIYRHMKSHVSEDARADYLAGIPLKELAIKAAEEGVSVLEHFSIVRAVLMKQFQLASSVNDRNAVGSLAGRLTEVLRAIGHISGEMGSMAANSITINNVSIMNSPVFANLQANLLHALAPFPEARAAVVTALRAMDDQSAPEQPMKVIEHNPVAESATKVADHVAST
jgi:AcrR family transcriptional regulator